MVKKPNYVVRDNEIVYPAPYKQTDIYLTSWVLSSSKEKQQAILDAHLNTCCGGKPFEYRPLLSTVLLVLADIKRVTSIAPETSNLGYTPEQDICIWMLCGAYKLVNGKRVLDHVVWYLPYIWVTNADTLATGREAYGYPKAFGFAQLPESPEDPGPLWANGLVLPSYASDSCVAQRRLFTLQRTDFSPCAAKPTFGAHQQLEAVEAIAKEIFARGEPACDWNFFTSTFLNLLGGHVPMVFLKQIRDACSSTSACYQAIVEANATVAGFSCAGFMPEGWDLQMYSYASVDMPAHLGLPHRQRLDLGFYVKFSFIADLGKEVWRFGGEA